MNCAKRSLLLTAMLFMANIAGAQTFDVSFDVPRLTVAEYHRPYIALWIAEPDNTVVTNLAVLYDLELADNEGQKWLKDMRQWWRRTGRTLNMPVDGVAGATRAPGTHDLVFSDKVSDLSTGEYLLLLEVVREVGGREILEIPFQWPPQEQQTLSAEGQEEIGRLVLRLSP